MISLQEGTLAVDTGRCPELQKLTLVKMYGIACNADEIRRHTENLGYQFGCYFEEDGLWVFRIPGK